MQKEIYHKVLLLAAGHAVTDLPQGAILVALPFLKDHFGLTYTQVSVIMLIQSLTSSVSQPIFGYWSDRKPSPWLMPVGCLLSGVGMLASLWASSYEWLLVFTFLSGLGVAAFHPEGAKAAHLLSGNAKGKGVSLFVVGGSAGMAAGSLFLAILLANGPGPQLFLYLVPSLIIGIPLFRVAARIPRQESGRTSAGQQCKNLASFSLLALLLVVFVRAMISSGLSTFIPLYFVSYLQESQVFASSLLSIYLAAGAIGTLIGGALSDRYGSKKVMLWTIAPVSLVVYLFQIASGVWIFAILAVASIPLSAAHSSSLVLAQRMMPGNVGMASGLTLGFSFGVGSLGVLILGRVADLWALPVVFEILTVLPLLGLVFTWFVQDIPQAETKVVLQEKT
jgi:MFS transporter, FSR family, fosmidomycin resistance protein